MGIFARDDPAEGTNCEQIVDRVFSLLYNSCVYYIYYIERL